MARGEKKHPGFRFVVAVVAAVGVIGAVGWLVYQHNHVEAAANINTTATPTQTATQTSGSSPVQLAYSNSAYGFSFNLPTGWTVTGDSTYNSKISATRQEFGTSLMPNAGISAVNIEVLDESLQTAEAWYDQFYAQTSIKVNKTTSVLKGKQSVLYDFVAPTYETKLYLFAVGSKTYMFSSVNESLNASTSANYWSDFNNVFNSLTFQK